MRFRATLSSVPTDLGLRLLPHSNIAERRHEYTIRSYRGRTRSRILYRMKAAGLCVLMLAGLGAGSAQFAPGGRWITSAAIVSGSRSLTVCTAPPAPGAARTIESGHAKPSSFAPHSRSHRRAYGAPVPRPIVAKHAKHKRRAASPPPQIAPRVVSP